MKKGKSTGVPFSQKKTQRSRAWKRERERERERERTEQLFSYIPHFILLFLFSKLRCIKGCLGDKASYYPLLYISLILSKLIKSQSISIIQSIHTFQLPIPSFLASINGCHSSVFFVGVGGRLTRRRGISFFILNNPQIMSDDGSQLCID